MNNQTTSLDQNQETVSCQGEESSSHPLVYLTLKEGKAVCPYCSKVFIKKESFDE